MRLWLVLVGIALATAGVMLWASWTSPLDPLALTLFQIIILGVGLTGSYLGGLGLARRSAGELVATSARPAFRRLLSMYGGLRDLGLEIETRRESLQQFAVGQHGQVRLDQIESALDILAARLVSQIATANDAMEDWKDLVPSEVAELEATALDRERKQKAGVLDD